MAISYCYVPRVENLSSSYYYGIVNNADIINAAIGRIFFASIDKLDLNDKFTIIGSLVRRNDVINSIKF